MKHERRQRALKRLESQLESGVKTKKGTFDKKEPLTEFDKTRIEKEIEALRK